MCDEVIYLFVEIGGIVDHHCIQLIFIARCSVNIRPPWSWLYDSWIYNYLCLSPLTLWTPMPLRRGVLDTTLRDQFFLWLTTSQWYSPCTPVSSTNKIYHHNITEILLKVALNTINQPTAAHVWNFSLMVRCLSESEIQTLQSSIWHMQWLYTIRTTPRRCTVNKAKQNK